MVEIASAAQGHVHQPGAVRAEHVVGDGVRGLARARARQQSGLRGAYAHDRAHDRAGFDVVAHLERGVREHHQAGDEVLTELSKKLTHLTQGDDLVARLGGDEFAIWFDAKGNRDAKSILSSYIEDEPFFSKFTSDCNRPFGASIGIIEINGYESKDLAQIMAEADQAMYKNKSAKNL